MSKNATFKQSRVKFWSANFSTVLSIFLLLFILGLLMLSGYHAFKFSNSIKESLGFKVNFFPSVSEKEALEFKKQLDTSYLVKSVQYISKEEAASMFTKELGEDFVSFLGENPLYPSLMVNLKANATEKNKIDIFIKQVARNKNVSEVEYNQGVLQDVNYTIYYIGLGVLAFALILLFIVTAIISNTIRMTIYVKRFSIRTMLLVGAKYSFIIKPYIIKSLKWAIIGGILAIALLSALLYFVDFKFSGIVNIDADLNFYFIIMAILLAFGIFLSLASTYFSVRRHIRIKEQKLY